MQRVIFAVLMGCMIGCGDTSTSVNVDQDNNQGGIDGEDATTACAACIGNPDDDRSDEECMASYGFAVEDCNG